MKRAIAMSVLSAVMLWPVPAVHAQDPVASFRDPGVLATQALGPCGSWSLRSLRGTYAFTATAWQDLSQINPRCQPGTRP